ncbi:MAG: type IV toxin-antitoxin system AbiEi family antitoxin domain-containing protein [Clostridiales bacterium]|nr:type IV toxin-antitoxin system AbiEi family antitoxin domain-containing protein [Clostridiales bacterium]
MSKFDALDLLVQANMGLIRTSDATEAGVSRTYFSKFVKVRGLERVKQGLYVLRDMCNSGMHVVQTRCPEAVFSHETALYLLGLADCEPDRYTITLSRKRTVAKGLPEKTVKAFKVNSALFDKGVVYVNSSAGHTLRTYCAERTICDLIRNRLEVDIQDLRIPIEKYIKQENKDIPLLMHYAKTFSIEKIVQQYLDLLPK